MQPRSRDDRKWLAALGCHLDKLIKRKGYSSPYEFWLESDIDISRTTLNYVLRGQMDVKATTLKKIASALELEIDDLLKNIRH